jgi:hypothetical protein
LAGSDGLESFREVFHDNSRLVVVLYRVEWGKTRWTRVEEGAVKDRAFNEGWDWLLFVMVDTTSKPPVWLPESVIRLNYAEYGIGQLLGAIKMRAQKLGSIVRIETAIDRAKRLQQVSATRAERERLLAQDGMTAFGKEWESLFQVLSRKLETLNEGAPTLHVTYGSSKNEFVLRTNHVCVNLYPTEAYSTTGRRVELRKWKGTLTLPQNRSTHYSIREPRNIGEVHYYFDWQPGYEWCWRIGSSFDCFMTTDEIAEQMIKILLDLQDKFERGEIRWSENE